MINLTALTAAFTSPRTRSDFCQCVDNSRALGFAQYVTNKKGQNFLRVDWRDGMIQITHKGQIVPRSVWIKALFKAGKPKASNVPMLLQLQAG